MMPLQPKYKQLSWIGGLVAFLILAFGACMTYLAHRRSYEPRMPDMEDTLQTLIYTIAILVCWLVNLFNSLVLQPVFERFSAGRWLTYLSSYVLYNLVCIPIWYFLFIPYLHLGPKHFPIPEVEIINTLILVVVEMILSKLDGENTKAEIASYKMAILQAQHEKLKHQLNPHFLFNSLNALKTLIKKQPAEAESYLLKLSEFLRFSISHNEQNMVSLAEELSFCTYYLDMQKTRFKEAFNFDIDIPEPLLYKRQLPVFSLQLLMENAIKHNVSTKSEPLNITVGMAGEDLLMVKNNLNPLPNPDKGEGIGLKNLSERYRLLIQQDIQVETSEGYFTVYLKIIPL